MIRNSIWSFTWDLVVQHWGGLDRGCGPVGGRHLLHKDPEFQSLPDLAREWLG